METITSFNIAKKEKRNAAMSSVIAAIFLTGLKLTVGLLTNSLGILSEAAHSGLDLVAALVTFFAVKIADKPADKEHTYGHGKFENLSAMFETFLLLITCVWIIYEAIRRIFFYEAHIEITFWSYAVMIVAIIIDYSRSRILFRAAKKHHSQALEADALHFSTDIMSSSVVLLGLFSASFGYTKADAFASLIVAAIVIWISLRLGKRTIDALMDRIPDANFINKIKDETLNIDGVIDCNNIRIRQSGARTFIDMTIQIKRTLTLDNAHSIINTIENKIRNIIPNSDIVIHYEPVESTDETILDKVKMILNRIEMKAHNIEANVINDKYYISFHLEMNTNQNLDDAHKLATDLENKIKSEIPESEQVVIHIDEENPTIRETSLINDEILMNQIKNLAKSEKGVIDCKDITIQKIEGKYKITLSCLFDKSLLMSDVHDASNSVENKIYSNIKEVSKVIVHSEPN